MAHTSDIHHSNDGTAAVPAGQAHTDRAGDAFAGSGAVGGNETVRAGLGDGAGLDGTLNLGDVASGTTRAQQIKSRTRRAIAFATFAGPGATTLGRTNEAITVDTTGGAVTVNLPALATVLDGSRYWIKNEAGGAANVTIDPSGAETIDGAATFVLTPGQAAIILAESGGWLVLTGGRAPIQAHISFGPQRSATGTTESLDSDHEWNVNFDDLPAFLQARFSVLITRAGAAGVATFRLKRGGAIGAAAAAATLVTLTNAGAIAQASDISTQFANPGGQQLVKITIQGSAGGVIGRIRGIHLWIG